MVREYHLGDLASELDRDLLADGPVYDRTIYPISGKLGTNKQGLVTLPKRKRPKPVSPAAALPPPPVGEPVKFKRNALTRIKLHVS